MESAHPATVVTWGVFDGVHRGHQIILQDVVRRARDRSVQSCALTFDRHPEEVLFGRAVPNLCTLEQKTTLIGAQGIDRCIVIPFTSEFAATDAEIFVRDMVIGQLNAVAIVLGYDAMFGRGRQGTISSLREIVDPLGVEVVERPPENLGGRVISSSAIREAIGAGRLAEAEEMLGRPFEIAGTVERGDRRGTSLGFPTANILSNGYMLPPNGVYAASIRVRNAWRLGVVNIGRRPTFEHGASTLLVETHLPRWTGGELYGESMIVRLRERLRDEKAFDSGDALARQIGDDVRRAESLCARSHWKSDHDDE